MLKVIVFEVKPEKLIRLKGTKEILHRFPGNPAPIHITSYLDLNHRGNILETSDDIWSRYLDKECPFLIVVLTKDKPAKPKKKKKDIQRYSKLPNDYIFKFGKYKGYSIDHVPSSYIEWFEANVL